MSASHAPGKPQIHLRMTLIPSSDSKFSSDERASSPVPPRITTEQSSSIAPPSQPATASASTLPPTPSATGVFRGRYTPQVPQVNGTSSLSAPASPRPPLVPVQREERQRTPLPQRGGPADVGIVLKSLDESLVVHEVLPAGPAAEGAKIGVGDALIDVDGFDVKGRPVCSSTLITARQKMWCFLTIQLVCIGRGRCCSASRTAKHARHTHFATRRQGRQPACRHASPCHLGPIRLRSTTSSCPIRLGPTPPAITTLYEIIHAIRNWRCCWHPAAIPSRSAASGAPRDGQGPELGVSTNFFSLEGQSIGRSRVCRARDLEE